MSDCCASCADKRPCESECREFPRFDFWKQLAAHGGARDRIGLMPATPGEIHAYLMRTHELMMSFNDDVGPFGEVPGWKPGDPQVAFPDFKLAWRDFLDSFVKFYDDNKESFFQIGTFDGTHDFEARYLAFRERFEKLGGHPTAAAPVPPKDVSFGTVVTDIAKKASSTVETVAIAAAIIAVVILIKKK